MTITKNIQPDTLLMFSGGLDSTGVFWKLLHLKKKFLVHHMRLENFENRASAEDLAISQILDYMANLSDIFTFTESCHRYPLFNRQFIWDSDLTSFMAGNICMAIPSIKFVALGLTKSDISGPVTDRIERANKVFSAFCNASKVYPIVDMTKQEVYNMLPADLRGLTWSCRTPIYKDGVPSECKRCIACMKLSEIKQHLAQRDQSQLS